MLLSEETLVLISMPNFDLTSSDGMGIFFQIFVSGFAFLQIYRIFRKINEPMSEIQWFGNSLLLSFFVLTVTEYILKFAPDIPPGGILGKSIVQIFFGLMLGFLLAKIMDAWKWIGKNKQTIGVILRRKVF